MQKRIKRAITVAQTFLDLVRANDHAKIYCEHFPRNIEPMILYALELPIQYRPQLSLYSAERYICALKQISFAPPAETPDRPLWGMLHVGFPSNLILIKEGLSSSNQNYVLAHEVGHFLTDVFNLRNLWVSTLPEQKNQIMKAFNWQDYDEWIELQAFIKGLPQRPRAIMARGKRALPETAEKELLADLIAREIIAPWDKAVQIYKSVRNRKDFSHLIHKTCGLPEAVAEFYFDDIEQQYMPRRDFFADLFSPLIDSDEKYFRYA
jgi:hypothetical protein